MRTNITNNLLPNNFFIRRKKPIYVDSTNKIYIKKFGADCSNLEIIYKNQTNTFINQNLKDITLTDNSNVEIDGILFNSESNLVSRIYPTYYFNIGQWKPINNNYICDDINTVLVDYPIQLISPNLIINNNQNYTLEFNIYDTIFDDKETFSVFLTPVDFNQKIMYTVSDNVIYDKKRIIYNIPFNTSIFQNVIYPFKDNKYYIALQSNKTRKIFLSDSQKYVYVTNNTDYSNIQFNINKNNLNYSTSINSNLLLNCYVAGLTINTPFQLKIQDLHDNVPIYYSPPIIFNNDNYYHHNVIIPELVNLHRYSIDLVYNNLEITDLKCGINIDLNYSYNIYILNASSLKNLSQTSSFNLILFIDPLFINSVLNISLENYFIQNVIITNDNYYNLVIPVKLDNTFDPGLYNVRIQTQGYYAKSAESICILGNTNGQIMPNFGYNNIPFSNNSVYNSINVAHYNTLTYYNIPYGVTQIDINIIYNTIQITGQILVKANTLLGLNNGILTINNREIINCITGNYVVNRIINYNNVITNLPNNINVKYICESSYVIQLYNLSDKITTVTLNTANNPNGYNLTKYGDFNVNYNSIYGYHVLLNVTSFDFTGELHFYSGTNYLGLIQIKDYPIVLELNLTSHPTNIVEINNLVSGIITLTNYNSTFPVVNNFDIYFVSDLYGNNQYYLGTFSNTNNTISFSFRYLLNLPGTKYLMIIGKFNNFIINQIINIPISIINILKSEAIVKTKPNNTNNAFAFIASAEPTEAPVVLVGVYTTFDTPPNKTTPSNFLQTYGLYTYKDTEALLGSAYANYKGYLVLQTDLISNGIPQTNTTLDSFTSFFISQLANKEINLIETPSIFKDTYTVQEFVTQTHTFEYYNNTILNNEQINIQSSLCSNVVLNNQLITDIALIKQNFSQSYNNQVRNYNGQNTINNKVSTITTNTNNPPRFAWIENLGYYIAEYFQLSINNVEIEKLTNNWINIWNEINLPVSKKSGNNKMIGNVEILTSYDSNKLPKYKLRIPIPFYFNRFMNAGLSIPLIALLHSDVKLTLQMEKLANLIISDPLTKYTASGRPKLSLELKYIYLEAEERRRFANSKHEYLIEQENYRNYSHYGTYFNTKLNFVQPVKDLYWYAQPKANISNANNRQYWNYTDSKYYNILSNYDRYDEENPITELSRSKYKYLYQKHPNVSYIPMSANNQLSKSDVPYPTKSPINNSKLSLNGQARFNDDAILTQQQYFMKYRNIPLSGINVYPFCLYPNEYQPSGACNFSALADAYIELDTDDGAYNVSIIARNYNLLRIMSGQAGLAFEL